jgi:uncharacterized protein (TIGR02001 family)
MSASHKTFALTAVHAALLALTLASPLAHAADVPAAAPASAYTVSGSLTLTNDYIWRGLSQSWGRPAAQVTVTVDHASGAYFSVFASNVAPQFVPNTNLETDWSLGYKTKMGGVDLDLGGVYVYYPGGNFSKASFTPAFDSSVPHTLELYASASANGFGLRLGYIPTAFFGWTPNNSGVDGVFNGQQAQAGLTGSSKGAFNAEGSYTWAVTEGWTAQAMLGHQSVPHSVDVNWNYARLGVSTELSPGWTVNVAASLTTQPKAFKGFGSLTNNGERSNPARNTLVVGLSKAF